MKTIYKLEFDMIRVSIAFLFLIIALIFRSEDWAISVGIGGIGLFIIATQIVKIEEKYKPTIR